MKVVVSGAGYAPLLCAIALKKKVAPFSSIDIQVALTSNEQQIFSSSSSLVDFHQWLGISEVDFIQKTQSGLLLATQIENKGTAELFSETPTGLMVNRTRFQHLYCKAKENNDCFSNYNIAVALYKEERFTPPSPNPKSIFHNLAYSYVTSAVAYEKYLLALAHSLHIEVHENSSIQKPSSSQHKQVFKLSEKIHHADLVITTNAEKYSPNDCNTPFEGLAEAHQSFDSNDIGNNTGCHLQLSCKSIIKTLSLNKKNTKTTIIEQLGNQTYKYRNKAISDNNIVYLGEAYAKLPHLIIDRCYLLQSQIMRLCKLWPAHNNASKLTTIYNRDTLREAQMLCKVDRILCHQAFPDRVKLKNIDTHTIELFKSSGSIAIDEGDCLDENTWLSLLFALGLKPNNYALSADTLIDSEAKQQLVKIKNAINNAAKKPLNYRVFLDNLNKS